MLASLQEDPYQVRIPAFEGPLDLLLQLIEREKLDISSISLAQVADQFLAYVRELEQIDAELLADFLVWRPGWCGSSRTSCSPSRLGPGMTSRKKTPPRRWPASCASTSGSKRPRWRCAASRKPATTPTCARRRPLNSNATWKRTPRPLSSCWQRRRPPWRVWPPACRRRAWMAWSCRSPSPSTIRSA